MQYCIYCGVRLSDSAAFCAACGKRQPTPAGHSHVKARAPYVIGLARRAGLAVLGLIAFVALAVIVQSPTVQRLFDSEYDQREAKNEAMREQLRKEGYFKPQPRPIENGPLRLVSHSARRSSLATTITGHVTNSSNEDLSYAQITFRVFSVSSKVGTALANVSGLRAGESWKFEAVCLCVGDRYEFESMSSQ